MIPEEIVLPLGAPVDAIPDATAIRSTVLLTSVRALRARGLFDRYVELLPPAHRERMIAMTAGAWLPMDVANVHYEACDRLGLDRAAILDIGAEAGRFLNQTVLSVVLRLSKEAGVTPWAALMLSDRLRARTWQGGKIALYKLGPKEARLEWYRIGVAGIPYFRVAFGGFIQGIVTLFARSAFVRELPKRCDATSLAYRCSWV